MSWNNIPGELRSLPHWVAAGTDKEPRNPRTGQRASVTDPTTWGTYEEACRAGLRHIGYVLTEQDPYAIIDLDNKPEKPLTPEQWARHVKILESFNSYTERSAGGRGYHIIVKGKIPSGAHRDGVEIYSHARYMICTGDVIRSSPISDYQDLLLALYAEAGSTVARDLGADQEEVINDEELVTMAMRAANGDKFNELCSGLINGYPSQSEADFALLSILAFYSGNNDQVRRLFRMSKLGQRSKAVKNDTYLDRSLAKIRAQQPPTIDPTELIKSAAARAEAATGESGESKEVETEAGKATESAGAGVGEVTVPPGLVGDLAQYFYSTAIRPVPEVAIAAALALMAGVCGRSYNISGSGLNQYLILLARTGSGKEGALSGIENLLAAVRPTVPMVEQFMGPAAFASGQALIRALTKQPCFVSVLGEFGITLQQLSDQRSNSAQLMLRKVLLDLYTKSGWQRTLYSNVYSDSEKNTAVIQAPCVTILGESTPETFFDGLEASHISEGLIPRFTVIQYSGDRPARNLGANCPPSAELVRRFIDLVTVSLTTTNNNSCAPVQIDPAAQALLDAFDILADQTINATRLEVEVQLWNRAHLKALKLAALLAVGVDPHNPTVTADLAQWAINFAQTDVAQVAGRFKEGDVGQGDSRQTSDLKKAIGIYLSRSKIDRYVPSAMVKDGVIPYVFLSRRTACVASFRTDRMGATMALKKQIAALIDSGLLAEINRASLLKSYNYSGKCYIICGNLS